jgi:hypothetical protein
MALNKNASAGTPSFESPDDDNVGADQTAEQIAAEQRAAAQKRLAEAAGKREESKPASTGTALTTPVGGQVAVSKPLVNPLEPLKNAFPVEFDTLRNLQINQGNVIDRETGKALGDTICLELLSFQDQWVIGPGGEDKSEEAKELVRYSDDGITSTKGDDMKEWLANLHKLGHKEAKMTERMVICGAVTDPGTKGKKEVPELQDALVQINLPPTSKAAFKRYQVDQAYRIGKGIIQPEGAQHVKIECSIVKRGDNTWTVAAFSRADA